MPPPHDPPPPARKPRQRRDMRWLAWVGRRRQLPRWAEPYRTDNTAALIAFNFGVQAPVWPLFEAFVNHWVLRGNSPWQLDLPPGMGLLGVASALGMGPSGGLCGCVAVASGYVGLRRADAGTVRGGRTLAFAGVVLSATGIVLSLLWAALVVGPSLR